MTRRRSEAEIRVPNGSEGPPATRLPERRRHGAVPVRSIPIPLRASPMLTFAYGSNLNRAGMGLRCPGAVPLGRAMLPDHALVFRRWADVEPCPGAAVAGGLWRITPACLAALDDYEDVAGGLYRRLSLPVWPEGAAASVGALVYRMLATHTAPPEPGDLAAIRHGCRDFGLDEAPVLLAAAAAR